MNEQPTDPTALVRKGLNLLIVFDIVAETRSVTLAAERLSLTQSALSHSLRRLRELFGDQLFIRGYQRLELTPRAAALVKPVRDLLRSAESLVYPETFDAKTFDKEVRLGVGESCVLLFDGHAMMRLKEAAPNLRLWIDTPYSDGKQKVREGTLDLGLWHADHVPAGLHSSELLVDRYVGVVHVEHPLAGLKRAVTLDEYLHYPHLHLELPGMRVDPLEAALKRHHAKRLVKIGTPSFLPAFAPLIHSLLIATVPSHLVPTARRIGFDLATFDLPFETDPLPYRMFWSDRTDADPAHAWFRRTMIELLQEAEAEAGA